jgi:hypothetical protein
VHVPKAGYCCCALLLTFMVYSLKKSHRYCCKTHRPCDPKHCNLGAAEACFEVYLDSATPERAKTER